MKNLFLFLLLFPTLLFSQSFTTLKTTNPKAKQYYEEGRKLVFAGNDQKALKAFADALKADPIFIDAQVQYAGTQYNMGALPEAEAGLQRALTLSTEHEPKIYYTLGNIQMKLEKYDAAAVSFENYTKAKNTIPELLPKAQKYAADCAFIAQAIQHPVPFEPKSLGELVNTPNSEYLPSLTADGEMLVYTQRIGAEEVIELSKKIDGVWQKGVSVPELEMEGNIGATCISADGKTLVFAANVLHKGFGSFDLYYSQNHNGTWSKPRNMGAPINTPAWESQPSLSADGNTLYFASDRAGGYGTSDLWVSHKVNGHWTEPQNLGKEINTPLGEQAPFIHPDGQTLYFTSSGHPGMGQDDLFYTRLDSTGVWGKPVNLGYPINTKDSEGTLTISLDGKTAYFGRGKLVSPKDAPRKIDYDLYSFELYAEARPLPVTYVKVTVTDALTKQAIQGAILEYSDLANGKLLFSALADENGQALSCLVFGKNYALHVSQKNYAFQSENFNLSQSNSLDKPFLKQIGLTPLAPSAPSSVTTTPTSTSSTTSSVTSPIVLHNVFFETGSASLRQESLSELLQLKSLLDERPTMHIRIQGHTDNVGSDADNQILSEKRAKAVMDYLIQQGVNADSLSYKGFGKTQPVDTNDTSEGRQNNRRTEFVILQ